MRLFLNKKIQQWAERLPTYSRLLAFSRRYWRLFACGILLTVLSGMLDGLIVWLLKPIIDHGLVQRDIHFIKWLPVLVIAIGFFRGIFACGSKYCIQRVGRSVVMDLRNKIFSHLLKLPMVYYDSESSGKIISLFIYNTDQLAFTATSSIMTGLRESAAIIGLLVVMFLLSWPLTGVFLLATPFIVYIFKYASRRLRTLSHAQQSSMADATHCVEESLNNMAVLRSYGHQSAALQQLSTLLQLKRLRELKAVVTDSLGTFAIQLLVIIPLAMTLYLATSAQFAISAGTFTAFISAMLSIRIPLQRLSSLNGQLQTGLAGAHSVFELLDHPVEDESGTSMPDCQGNINFEQLSFVYTSKPNQPVLSDFSLSIKSGETVAFVGLSGAGKSTLFKLLQRFYEPTAGRITMDGTNIADIKRQDLRSHIAIVNQDITLFHTSVRNNLCYGLPETPEENIIEAAKAAHAWAFIQQLPQGLDTPIGPQGTQLSGGQKQRIAIARALIHQRRILLLDEATSALDSVSEQGVQSGLYDRLDQQTTLIIAHRLSTIMHADRIIVLHEGRLIEQGTHADLLAAGGEYHRLYQLQFATAESD